MNLNEEKLSLSDIKRLYSTYKKKYAKAKADKDAKEGKKPKKGEKSESNKNAPRFKSLRRLIEQIITTRRSSLCVESSLERIRIDVSSSVNIRCHISLH